MKNILKIACATFGLLIGALAIYAFTSDQPRWNDKSVQLALTAQVLFLGALVIQVGQKKQDGNKGLT
ncbi:hypothetical protein [Oligoflexus tunisiensis]|uniref:hypothetical protein n=1 Tax=Oligoflexus tunisiensis TaxID=708132 RepID=UPI00114CEBC8|nr:hypothetical protein [Oligoflexus tunisiensis]